MDNINEQPIKVYIKVNSNNEVIAINSSVFIKNPTGWIKIDEGFGNKYSHAEVSYLSDQLVDENFKFNYKYEKGKIVRK